MKVVEKLTVTLEINKSLVQKNDDNTDNIKTIIKIEFQ